MNTPIPVTIQGANGMVGQRFIQLLDQHPYFHVSALTDRWGNYSRNPALGVTHIHARLGKGNASPSLRLIKCRHRWRFQHYQQLSPNRLRKTWQKRVLLYA
jgi:hypothetical protein